MQAALTNLLLFARLNKDLQTKVVDTMWVKQVRAGEILIQEGEMGLASTELYVVKDGKFEVSGWGP